MPNYSKYKLLIFVILFQLAHVGYTEISANNKEKTFIPQYSNPFNDIWRWQSYTELIGKGCRCMVEEKNGNLWFGVNGRVIKYDGLEWNFYDLTDISSKTPVVALFVGHRGTIYAGTTDGISRFDQGNWEKLDLGIKFGDANEYPFNRIPIIEGSDRSIWIGSKQGALRIRNEQMTLYREDTIIQDISPQNNSLSALEDFDIYSLFEDSDGSIWVGLRDGRIYNCKLKDYFMDSVPTWQRIDQEPNYVKIKYPLIQKNNEGHTYIASGENDGGININTGSKWKRIKLMQQSGMDDIFTDIIKLKNGSICIAGIGRVYIENEGDWEMYANPKLPFASNRLILYQGMDQSLWILGLSNEVWKIDLSNDNWTTFKNLIFQTEDTNNNYWFITFNGEIVQYNSISEKWKKFDISNGVMDSPVTILVTKEGKIWAAGSHHQVATTAFYDGTYWIKTSHPDLGWGIDRRAVLEADDGSLWFGSSTDILEEKGQKGGLVRYFNTESANLGQIDFEYYHTDDSFRLLAIYGMAQTPDGIIWAGQLGFYKFNIKTKNWKRISEPHGLDGNFIDCIDTSPDGDLWVGTRTDGIFLMNASDNSWKHFTTENGLSSNTIVNICAENSKNIWVATDKDISHFDGNSWTENVFSRYFKSRRDGISIHKTSDGSLWINQIPPIWYRNALYNERLSSELADEFKTIKHFPDKIPPETNITFSQDEISQPGNVILSWIGNDPWESTPSSKIEFSYKIDDNNWSLFTSKTSDIFLSLEEGDHIFEVRARDLDFNVDASPAKISFYVVPPTWKQPWFIILIITFLSIIFFFIVYLYHRNKIIHEISETKVRLFANISHELRTPLTLILGPLVKVMNSPLLNKELSKPLDLVHRNTNRLLGLVNQVLDFRKIEVHQLKFEPKKGDIIRLLKEEVNAFHEATESKKISLNFESFTQKLIVWFDPDKIEKIIFNILANALKFTPSNGSVSVKVSRLESKKTLTMDVGENQPMKFQNWLLIAISDSGVGIAKRNLDKIFNRFYQAEANSKISVGGTGIGLSVAKEMVIIHGGKINVESLEGIGTSFKIQIPLLEKGIHKDMEVHDELNEEDHSRAKISEGDADQIPSNGGTELIIDDSKEKILIVEDDQEMREYIKDELKKNYRIFEASNGNEGLKVALNESPDLVLSDIMMPHVDGIEFCRKLKTDERTSHIAVILLTALTSQEYKIEGLETGADGYLTKPFYIDELCLRINNILDSRRKFREKFGKSLKLEPSSLIITSVDQKFIKRAIDIIEENMIDPEFGVERFSRLIGMSRVGLYNKLKSLANHSVQEFIFVIKLKRAAQLLRESGKSVTEIAYDVGFKDPSHFSKLFKKQFGQAPKAYINEHNKDKG